MAMTLTLLATSCANDDIFNLSDADKNMISFSLSDGSRESRAGFTGADTRIVARFQSDEKNGSGVRYTKTVLKANVDATGGADDFSTVEYYTGANTRYWDDAFGRKGQISVYAVAIPNSTVDTKLTESKLTGSATTWQTEATPDNTIDWDVTYSTTQTSATLAGEDLAYSNNIQDGGKNGRYVWSYTSPEGYPTNNGRLDGHSNGRLEFTQKDGAQASDAGHFDKGHLMFNHALSRLTVVLVPGTGYAAERSTASDFKFNKIGGAIESGNIQLLNFPVHGKLDLDAGSWTIDGTDGTKNILQMIGAAATSSSSASAAVYNADEKQYLNNRTYSAQMLPGKVFGANSAENVMKFVIDDNTYFVTEKMVYDALTTGSAWFASATNDDKAAAGYNVGTSVTMTQGHNYVLYITVGKTGIINVTATLAPWVEVAGKHEVNNAHINLTLNTSGQTCDKSIDLYRLIDNNDSYDQDQYVFDYEGRRWYGNYSTDSKYMVTLSKDAYAATTNEQGYQMKDTKKYWSTPWYFESNKEYYHFRTVNNGTTIKGNDDATNDYFEISAGPIAEKDPHWGAPMKSTTTTWLKYDDNNTLTNYSDDKGYEAHLYHAIGATESQVAIQELHMMSNIKVILKTPNDGGKVTLKDGDNKTIVKITRIAANGKVEMGRGVVTPTGEYTGDLTMTTPTTYYKTDGVETNEYSYAVVPQALSRDFDSDSDNDYIGIFIQTPDHNQYYVVKKLSEIKATSVSDQRNQTLNDYIKRWYPGHTYTYTFTITKTGIENITCTVAEWVTVTGENTNLDLED